MLVYQRVNHFNEEFWMKILKKTRKISQASASSGLLGVLGLLGLLAAPQGLRLKNRSKLLFWSQKAI